MRRRKDTVKPQHLISLEVKVDHQAAVLAYERRLLTALRVMVKKTSATNPDIHIAREVLGRMQCRHDTDIAQLNEDRRILEIRQRNWVAAGCPSKLPALRAMQEHNVQL